MISTRDVTFDELTKYYPDDLKTALIERIEEPLQLIEFPDSEELAGGVDEWETSSIDSDLSSTIEVIPRDPPSEDIPKDPLPASLQSQFSLLTPETTPAPQGPSQ